MIIVYAAVAGQSVVKLYAAAMFPGFFLAFLYLVYIIGWALINPKIAPPLPEEQTRVPVPAWLRAIPAGLFAQHARRRCCQALFSPAQATAIETRTAGRIGYRTLLQQFRLSRWCRSCWSRGTLGRVWWYVVIHQQVGASRRRRQACSSWAAPDSTPAPAAPAEAGPPPSFYLWFCGIAAALAR